MSDVVVGESQDGLLPITCRRCSRTVRIGLPVGIDDFDVMARAFEQRHEACGQSVQEHQMTTAQLNEIALRASKAMPGPWLQNLGDVWCYAGPEINDWSDGPDLEFVAHSREDIPALIAEINRLRSALQE